MAKLKDLKVTIGLSKKGLTKLNGDIRRMKGNFRRNFGEISGMASRLGGMLVSAVGAGLTAVIKSGAKLQTLEVGFRSLMGGAEEASKMVQQLNKFTAQTPFQLEDVARSARQLLAVGTAADDVNARLKMLGDIAAASGNSIGDIAATFAKVQAKGKVELESLNQLAERNIPIFDALRQVTGDANMEFGAGAVSVEQYNQALANMAAEGGFANDAMLNLSETVDGKLSTAFDNVEQALGKFARETGLLDTVTNILDDFTAGIQHMTLSTDDLQKSRDDVYELRQAFKEATKDNVQGLRDQVRAAEIFATTLQTKLGEEAVAGHLAGIRALKDEIDEAMAFGTLPAGAPAAPAAPATAAKEEKKVKEQLIEVEKSRLMTLGKIDELQSKSAVDILAAAYAQHELKGAVEQVQAVTTSGGWMQEMKATLESMVVSSLQLATTIGNQLGNALHDIVRGTRSAGEAFKRFAASAIKAALAASQANIIAAAISSGMMTGPKAMIVIPALITAGMVLYPRCKYACHLW